MGLPIKPTTLVLAFTMSMGTAFAKDSPTSQTTGKDIVESILTPDVRQCFNTALRTSVGDETAKIEWKETLNPNGHYMYHMSASSLKGQITSIEATAGFTADNHSIGWIPTMVSASDLFNEHIGSFSYLGATIYFDNPESLELSEQTIKAEENLRKAVWKCTYNEDIDPGEPLIYPPVKVPSPDK